MIRITPRQEPRPPRREERRVRPSLVDDPCLDQTLEELDLALNPDDSQSYAAPPPLMARLFLPQARGRWSKVPVEAASDDPDIVLAPPPSALPEPAELPVHDVVVSDWMVSATLVLLVFAGAAAGALVFHERLSAIVFHLQTRLR